MPHKRSQKGKQNQTKRQEDYELLSNQRKIANWLINGTDYHDNKKRETVAVLTTEDVYEYIKECVGVEPHPACAPQQLDGSVIHDFLHGDGLFDVPMP